MRKYMRLHRIGPGNWALCLKEAEGNPATAAALMKDRRETNATIHYETSAWTPESFNVLNKRMLGARKKYNPLIKYAQEAVEAHRKESEFYLTEDIVDANGKPYTQVLEQIAEQDAKKPIGQRRVIDLGKVTTYQVQTDAFADDHTIVWLAGGEKPAEKYGLFLRNNLRRDLRLQGVSVYHASLSDQNFTRSFWFYGLDRNGRSDFLCGSGGLGGDDGSVFGESDSAEDFNSQELNVSEIENLRGRTQKISESVKIVIKELSLNFDLNSERKNLETIYKELGRILGKK